MMFSTYGKNDHDQKCNDNNDCPDIGDSAALILTSQYLNNNNRNYSYFNPANSTHNPILIQPEQIDSYSSENSSGHEHLMILATAAVNASPSNDNCKSRGNIVEPTINRPSESHFSIHDPPLIRLSPTSPNNIFRQSRYNDEITGITNGAHNYSGYSSNNVDWLSQELYDKTDNIPGELTHPSLKRQSYNNSLSDNEFPPMRNRGRARLRFRESREFCDNSQNSSTNPWSRRDLKRKVLHNPRSTDSQHNSRTSVDDYSTNLNTGSFINLTESDTHSYIDDRTTLTNRFTPELARRHYQWWPIKRHCPVADNDDLRIRRQEPPANIIASSTETTSPLYEASQHNSQFSQCSPPFYMLAGNHSDQLGYNRETSDHTVINSGIGHHSDYNNQHEQAHINIPTLSSNTGEYQLGDSITTSPNVSSNLQHILISQLSNSRRFYIPQPQDRAFPDRVYSQSEFLESSQNYPRQSPSGRIMQTTISGPETQSLPDHQNTSSRSSRLNAHLNNAIDDQHLLPNIQYRRNSISSTMNTFLRAYGLEEIQQRELEESYQSQRNLRIHSDAVRIHISEGNFSNPILDNRSRSQFHRPYTMYESQGNVESVIQLALHLETSWCGISPEELSRLPCHYYSHDNGDSFKQSDKQDKCMVCLDEFLDNDQLRTLSCGHQYHVSCVDKWLKMNRTCPMCRSDAVMGSSSYFFVN